VSRRWVSFCLAVSLALNLFLLSVGGMLAFHLRADARAGIMALAESGLSRPDQSVMNENLQAARPSIMAAFQQVQAAHLAADAALRQMPPDPAAIRAAMDLWREAVNNFIAAFEPPLVQALVQMSQQGRDTLATRGDMRAHFAAGLIKP
jgi:uncharacterized membrane protein